MRKDKGVSAVMGVVLMVSITIAIAATVYVFVSDMTDNTSDDQIIKDQIIIHGDYEILDIQYTRSDIDYYYDVVIVLTDQNNTIIKIDGFLFNFFHDELFYDKNNDIISLIFR